MSHLNGTPEAEYQCPPWLKEKNWHKKLSASDFNAVPFQRHLHRSPSEVADPDCLGLTVFHSLFLSWPIYTIIAVIPTQV